MELNAGVAGVLCGGEDVLDEALEATLRRAVGAREVVLPPRPAQAELFQDRAEGNLQRAC